jgi:hypothetical protein
MGLGGAVRLRGAGPAYQAVARRRASGARLLDSAGKRLRGVQGGAPAQPQGGAAQSATLACDATTYAGRDEGVRAAGRCNAAASVTRFLTDSKQPLEARHRAAATISSIAGTCR